MLLMPQSFADTSVGGLSCPIVIYPAANGGYISGDNNYGDLQKLQMYNPSSSWQGAMSGNLKADSVSVLFSLKFVSSTTPGNVFATVYSGDEINGPQTLLATSDTINMSAVDTSGGLTTFHFSSPVSLTGKYFVGVYLSSQLFDIIAIASSQDNCVEHPNYSWDQQIDSSFHAINDVLNWGLNTDLGIFPYTTYDTLTLGSISINNSSLSLFPNPAQDFLHLNITNNESIIAIELFSMDGKNQKEIIIPKSNTIDISSLQNGIYFIRIRTQHDVYHGEFQKI